MTEYELLEEYLNLKWNSKCYLRSTLNGHFGDVHNLFFDESYAFIPCRLQDKRDLMSVASYFNEKIYGLLCGSFADSSLVEPGTPDYRLQYMFRYNNPDKDYYGI
jgi:hypothetical protein